MKLKYILTFYQRIQLSLLFLVILPFTISSIITYVIINNEVTDRITSSNQQILNIIASDLTDTIDDITFSTVMIARDTTIKEKLNSLKGSNKINTFQEYQNVLEVRDFLSLLETKMIGAQSKIFFVNPSEYIIHASQTGRADQINSDWNEIQPRVDLNNTRTIQSLGVIHNDESNEGDYFFGRVIRHHVSNEYLGTLVIRIPDSYFASLFKNIEMGRLILVDQNGEEIARNQTDSFSDKEILRIEQNISRVSWSLVSEISQKEITGSITKVFFLFFILIVLFILVFFLLSIYMSKRLIKPLKSFEKIVKEFVRGNHSVRFQVKGKDEIAIIGNTFNNMLDQIKDLIQRIEHEQEEKKVLELQSLSAQIRPHFLMNTLNSIKCNLSISGDPFHSKKIDSLISLLRSYMRVNVPNTIAQECKLINAYLDIMNMRNGTDIAARIDIEDGLENVEIPRLLIQPIIENSIIHGFVDREPNANINICAYASESEIQISISDNGKGMTKEKCDTLNLLFKELSDELISDYDRVGLINIAQRLKLTYGQEAYLEGKNNEKKGTTFIMHIPKL
ncbi:sensor histidine kinase YesM [Neobacillus niacini]|uniref:cache domain-containing sensor histidine kinase n=1 Tax=Neobacillus niacini TaxID=86668 RepID=UPI002861E88E|nr:histidine kinase [Neobacillus niacini]MDR7078471.1 sensor histidine kinase YesM [Neobacillus niacini]